MNDPNRHKLLFGPYRMPRCQVGRTLRCAIRGTVKVRGIREAPIQWPYTICHWWGVGTNTVWTGRIEYTPFLSHVIS